MNPIQNFDDLLACLSSMRNRKRVAMACPADSHTRYVVERGLKEGFADFMLVCAGECKPEFDSLKEQYPDRVEVLVEPTPDDAARKAVALAHCGAADVLMKGTINTDNLLHAVLDKERGLLRPGSILSHVTATHIPAYGKFVVFVDAAVIPRPHWRV